MANVYREGADKTARINQVSRWLIEGLTVGEIMQRQKWGISSRTMGRYIEQCREEWQAKQSEETEVLRAKKLAELEALKKSLQKKYHGKPSGIMALLNIEKQIIALMGLNKPEVKHITTPEGQPIQVNNSNDIDYNKLSPEVLREIVNARSK
jgi:hypothetical protein